MSSIPVDTEADRSGPPTMSLRKLGAALMLGTALEWYDYFVYGVAAALVLNKLFFPSFSPTVGTLLSFGTFASAWLMRPLGALIFGYLGDRIGRRSVLFMTLIGMGVATIATGLLPTYSSIGIWAPLLLILFRLIQGLSAGGEFSGVATMSIEHAPPHLRGRYTSFAQMGIPAALIGANLVSLIAYYMPEDALESYGWRIPFLVSAFIFPIAIFIRLKLEESPVFEEKKAEDALVANPLAEVLRNHWRSMLALGFANGALGAAFYAYTTYSVNYGSEDAGMSKTTVLLAVIIAGCAHLCSVGFVGWNSDKIGPKRVFISALALLVVAPLPIFWIIHQGNAVLMIIGMVIGLGIGHRPLLHHGVPTGAPVHRVGGHLPGLGRTPLGPGADRHGGPRRGGQRPAVVCRAVPDGCMRGGSHRCDPPRARGPEVSCGRSGPGRSVIALPPRPPIPG